MSRLRLDQILIEDVEDAVPEWEESLGINPPPEAYRQVRNFGDICDVVEAYMQGEAESDCTQQQAFYRLRKVVSQTFDLPVSALHPSTRWEELVKGRKRSEILQKLKIGMGVRVNLFGIPEELSYLISCAALISLCCLLISFSVGLFFSAFTTVIIFVSIQWGQKLRHKTLGDSCKELCGLHYRKMRRNPTSFNPTEVRQALHDFFTHYFDLDPQQLHPHSPLTLS